MSGRVKKLLNHAEEVTHSKLEKVCERFGARVFSKPRIADVFSIYNSGLNDDEYSLALKSHFDFVVTYKDTTPLFSVEYDGPSHLNDLQRNRDLLKNTICSHFDYPLLRINSNYINREYRGMDLLTYFVSVWFLHEEFIEAQVRGQIPSDEYFDPILIISSPEWENSHPYWLSLDIQLIIKNLYKKNKVAEEVPSFLIGVDQDKNYRCLSWLQITDDKVLCEKTAMKVQNYPIHVPEFLHMIIMFNLYDSLENYFQNGNRSNVVSRDDLDERINRFETDYEIISH